MKNYSARFGTGDPRTFTGLAPTFIFFVRLTDGATQAPPSITEQYVGTGIYTWAWGTTQPIGFLLDAATTSPGTGRYVTGQLDPSDRSDEYGNTLAAYGLTTIAIGTTGVALGTTGVALGTTAVSNFAPLGSTLVAIGNTSSVQSVGGTLTAIGLLVSGLGNTQTAIGSTLAGLMGAPAVGGYGSTSADPTTLFGFLQRSQEFWEGDNTYTKATGVLQFFNRGSTTLLRTKTIADSSTTTTKTGV